MKKIIFMAVCLTMIACMGKNNTVESQHGRVDSDETAEQAGADDDVTIPDPTAVLYLGTYREVNVDGYDAQLRMWAWEDELQLKLESFYEDRMTVNGKIDRDKAVFVDSTGVKLPITLHVMDDGKEVATDDVVLSFTNIGDKLYKLHVDFVNEPSETPVRNLMSDYTMILTDPNVGHIVNWVPFNIDKDNIKLAKLLPELNKYVFMPELWATVKYITDPRYRDSMGETEMVAIDECRRFFRYSWGEININLEGKYFHTDDGKIILVTDQHDSTYEYDQSLQFFVIDPEKGLMTEEEAYNLLPKDYIDRNSIFQVRTETEGVVAVYANGEGGLDAKTLKFNGKTFE